MMCRRLSVCVAICVVLLATCARGASLAGKWSGQQGTVEYKQDGNSVTG